MAWYNNSAHIGYLPGSTCATTPPTGNRCSFDNPTTNINHGALPLSSVNGNRASVNVPVSCTRDTNVKIEVLNTINLGNDITSTLDLNGHGLGGTFTLPAGTSNLTLTSTLSTPGGRAGPLSGNTIIVVNYN
ncbi:hypothetical protein [Serratia ureilytica]|uniref:MrpH family fimbial adhesin n=1 Tax=Serratia ureilytica TaxID=300181 RepID=UPI003BEF01CE